MREDDANKTATRLLKIACAGRRRPEPSPTPPISLSLSSSASGGGASCAMETKKKPSRGYLCFGPSSDSDGEGEEQRRGDGNSSDGTRRRRRWWARWRSISKLFSQSPSKRGSAKEDDSNRSSSTEEKSVGGTSWKLMDDESRTSSSPVFTSSASPSLSSSSSSSSFLSSSAAYAAASPDAPEPKLVRRRKLPAKPSTPARPPSPSSVASAAARRCGSLKWLVLLLVSLSVIVFCGRLSAILWTSSCLCFVARWNFINRASARPTPRAVSLAPPAPAQAAAVAEAVEPSRRGLEEGEKKRVVMEGFLERNRRA